VLALLLVAVSLGVDNFAAAIAVGVSGVDARTRLRVGLVFGAFEAGMPLLGLVIGAQTAGLLGHTARWVGAALLIAVGGSAIIAAARERARSRRTRPMADVGAATTADATAAWGAGATVGPAGARLPGDAAATQPGSAGATVGPAGARLPGDAAATQPGSAGATAVGAASAVPTGVAAAVPTGEEASPSAADVGATRSGSASSVQPGDTAAPAAGAPDSAINRDPAGGFRQAGSPRFGRLLASGLALSVDNLVVGFALGASHTSILLGAVVIGVVSAAMSLTGLELGARAGRWAGERSEQLAGLLLIFVGVALGTGLLG
jgi:putative Mn2+ efflux pump MntP